MSPQRRNLTVGLVVLVSMIALAWMILKFASSSFSSLLAHGAKIQISCGRVDGVSEGSPIQYLGVDVGHVVSVRRLDNNREVIVEAVLDPGPPLPVNVEGVIRAQSALGSSAAISLELKGEPSSEFLKEGSKVRASFTGSGLIPPEITGLISDIRQQQFIRHLDETVMSFRQQLDRAGRVLESTEKVINDPTLRDDVHGTIVSVRRTSENLEKFSGRLDEVVNETNTTLKQVRTTVADGQQKVDDVGRQLGERLSQIGEVMERLNSITAKIDKGQGTLGMLVNDPRLYESLNDTSATMKLTVKDLQRLVEQWEQEGFTLKLK